MRNPSVNSTYEAQAEALLASIKAGVAPWAKPWQSLGAQRNAATGRLYNGGNALYLAAVQAVEGYDHPLWLTWRQASKLGGHVKQGEWKNGRPVLWFRLDEKVKTDENGEPVLDNNGDPKTVNFWRSGCSTVYNVAQTTVETKKYQRLLPEVMPEHKRNTEVENFLAAVVEGSTFTQQYTGDRACYIPALDEVRIPPAKLYKAIEEF